MRKFLTICLLLSGITTAFAQKIVPEIKDGTSVLLTVFIQGNDVPVYLTLNKVATAPAINWSVDGYGDGTIQLTEKGLNTGNAFFNGQPAAGTTNLSDNETWSVLSKSAFKSLVDNKSFEYGGTKFKIKEGAKPFSLDGKEVDAFTVESENGSVRLCVLNNPTFPLLLETSGLSIDTMVQAIK